MSIRTNVGNRDKLLKSTESYLQGNIDKHKANVDNLLDNNVALAEHPDIIETLDKEIDIMSSYEDKLSVLKKYFVDKQTNTKELLKD